MTNQTNPKTRSTFKRGIGPGRMGAGVYTCGACGKKTRNTDPEAAAVEMCRQCYKDALHENAVADGDLDPTEPMI